MIDEHTHCACNGIMVCTTCHNWIHANPLAARQDGLIVGRHITEPFTVPIVGYWGGFPKDPDTCLLTCTGSLSWENRKAERAAAAATIEVIAVSEPIRICEPDDDVEQEEQERDG